MLQSRINFSFLFILCWHNDETSFGQCLFTVAATWSAPQVTSITTTLKGLRIAKMETYIF